MSVTRQQYIYLDGRINPFVPHDVPALALALGLQIIPPFVT